MGPGWPDWRAAGRASAATGPAAAVVALLDSDEGRHAEESGGFTYSNSRFAWTLSRLAAQIALLHAPERAFIRSNSFALLQD